MPPSNESASPIEETTASNLLPVLANGVSVAVTITAATLSTLTAFSSTVMPILSSILTSVCTVNSVWSPSPVPLRPTTNP